ncbi:major facilitator superfamily domain-containing protein [Baffinella frigidus]|nr:major facilitator superfamily domain-containing protein [Cryptophyta sp. CCMP2293]
MGALFCVAGTASAFAQSLLQFSILRFITGIGIGSMIPVTDAYVLEWSPTEWRSKLVVGLIGVAFALGTIFAAGIGILVHEGFGDGDIWWRVFLLICVLPGLIGVPLIYFMLPESVHYLLVKGDRAEIKRLLKEMSEANGTALLADGEVYSCLNLPNLRDFIRTSPCPDAE